MEANSNDLTPGATPTQSRHTIPPPPAIPAIPYGGLSTPPTTQAEPGTGTGNIDLGSQGPNLRHYFRPSGAGIRSTTPTTPPGEGRRIATPHTSADRATTPSPPSRRKQFDRGDLPLFDTDIAMAGNSPVRKSPSTSRPSDPELEMNLREERERRREEAKRKRPTADIGAPPGLLKPTNQGAGSGFGTMQRKILELEKRMAEQAEKDAQRIADMEAHIHQLSSNTQSQPAKTRSSLPNNPNPPRKPATGRPGAPARLRPRSRPVTPSGSSPSRQNAAGQSGSNTNARNNTGERRIGARPAPGGRPVAGSTPTTSRSSTPTTNRTGSPYNNAGGSEVPDKGSEPKPRYRRQYQLTRFEIPAGSDGIKLAFMFHIRVLWNQIDRRAIPFDPSAEALRSFNERFTSEDDIYKQRYAEPIINEHEVNIQDYRTLQRDTKNKNYARLKLIPDTAIGMMRMTAARYGLKVWAPDLRQAPYGLYNFACRMSAIDSFRQAITSGIYDMFKPDTRFSGNLDFLIKVYDHTVHYLHYRRYLREVALPGANAALEQENTALQNRRRLADSRLLHAKKSGYPKRYYPLLKPKATSDDERDANNLREGLQAVFWVKKRPERSSWANDFYRLFGAEHTLFLSMAPNKQRLDRIRRIPPHGMQDVTIFKRLPKKMPLDYYDPSYYNSLPPRLRVLIADHNVMVFLPDVQESFQRPDLERLSAEEFMELPEIQERKSLYQVPDLAEAERGSDDDEYDDEDEDEDDDEDDDEGDVMEIEGGNNVDPTVALGREEAEQEEQRRRRFVTSAAV